MDFFVNDMGEPGTENQSVFQDISPNMLNNLNSTGNQQTQYGYAMHPVSVCIFSLFLTTNWGCQPVSITKMWLVPHFHPTRPILAWIMVLLSMFWAKHRTLTFQEPRTKPTWVSMRHSLVWNMMLPLNREFFVIYAHIYASNLHTEHSLQSLRTNSKNCVRIHTEFDKNSYQIEPSLHHPLHTTTHSLFHPLLQLYSNLTTRSWRPHVFGQKRIGKSMWHTARQQTIDVPCLGWTV